MANEISWIKLAVGIGHDLKIRHLRTLPNGDSVVLAWILLLELAGYSNAKGRVYMAEDLPYTAETLADEFQMPPDVIQTALKEFETLHMIDYEEGAIHITNWEKHQNVEQMEAIREYNRVKQQEHRERLRQAAEESSAEDAQNKALTCQTCQDTKNKSKNKKENTEKSAQSDNNADFEAFWALYPRKVGKQKARAAFDETDVSPDIMLPALRRQLQSDQWQRDGGRYIPLPTTWLNQERWEDELPAAPDCAADPEDRGPDTGTERPLPRTYTQKDLVEYPPESGQYIRRTQLEAMEAAV